MREIKFRGKILRAEKWSKWIYGSLDFTKYTYNEARIVRYDDPAQYWYKIDKNTIGQYTGLKDKNGKEIYEGDIVKIDCSTMKMIGEIRYSEMSATFFIYDKDDDIEETLWYQKEEFEVIGNIYDNPELLGKE